MAKRYKVKISFKGILDYSISADSEEEACSKALSFANCETDDRICENVYGFTVMNCEEDGGNKYE